MPPLALECIASWKKYLPDYEIKQWDESNFDVNMIPYTAEAYKQKKYAFVSDFARFWIVYKYGGVMPRHLLCVVEYVTLCDIILFLHQYGHD